MLEQLTSAFVQNLSPSLLILIVIGTLGGLTLGAMPGLSATMGLALLIPFTFTMSPVAGLVLLGAFYMGAIYGGSFTAILVNTPGTPSSIATAFDGYPLTRQGRSEEAIVAATAGSFFGGLFGVAALIFLAPPLAAFSLRFGPPEYFWVAVFGLTIIASLASESLFKGLIGGLIGLLLSTIGIAPVGGDVRFTFGVTALQGGVALIPALIGFFTIPELIKMVAHRGREAELLEEANERSRGVYRAVLEILRRPVNLVRSSVLGVLTGILPGAGGNIANLVAYNEAKRASPHPERFGKGEIDGVVAAESANNATVAGSMVPMLTLGIPGAPPDAIILGVLLLHGLRPGAELFSTQGELTYTFILSMAFAAVAMVPIGLTAGRALQRAVVRMPTRYLAPGVMLLSIVGSFAIRNNIIDVFVMLLTGLLGYALLVAGFHPAPVVLGLILGPIAETGLVQGLLIGTAMAQPWLIFFTRPISLAIAALCVISAAWPFYANWRRRRRGGATRPPSAADTPTTREVE
ncbi:MAG: C4-dicarboxylate ABC transporter permease [Nitriliruptorales bacterium]|nr:C4-dicarboxylate ABC transporter permease [Nitriliruptorales bacterium]